jgi:secreted trypsin-like serine protease
LALPATGAAAGPPALGPSAHSSIVGGSAASILDFPSLAYVSARTGHDSGFACTGTVIAPRVILTAAHCVEDLDAGGLTPARAYAVATGLSNPHRAGPGDVLRVAGTHVFPGFDPGTVHGDAAILVLATPTPALPLPLATAADRALYEGGAEVLLAGWGLQRASASAEPKQLQSTSAVVLAPRSCKPRTRRFYPVYSPALQLCTGDPPDHASGGCYGDSGGPAIAHRPDGSAVEIGITSTGGPGCSTKLPNVFTRTDRVSTWAAEWVAAIEQGAPPPRPGLDRLPKMSGESAEGFVLKTLVGGLGERFLAGEDLQGSCLRLGRSRVRCEIGWRLGRRLYKSTVVVYYAFRHDAVVWGKRLSVRSESLPGRLR